jgi:bromodomain-containing factor 1
MPSVSSTKKKKAKEVELSPEMDECAQALAALMSKEDALAFNEPVDWEGLGLLDYPEIVKNPMDLATIQVPDNCLPLTAWYYNV